MPRLLRLSTLIAVSFYFLCVETAPVANRKNFAPGGPTGELSMLKRLQDTIGTATQIWANGPAAQYHTISASRTGPISAVYRAILASNASAACKPSSDNKCEIGVNGFSTVGEVHYIFNNSRENLQGRSTQVMLACRCIEEEECNTAVLVRPINIVKPGSDGKMEDTDKQVCLYEAVDENFSNCHSELVRVSKRSKADEPQYAHEHNYFTYKVPDPTSEDYWEANGQRGWTHNCTQEEVNALPPFDISSLKKENLTFNEHKTSSSGPFCRPPEGVQGVQYYRDSAGSGDTCATLYRYAAPSGAYRATQQDEIAVGKDETTFVSDKPSLTSYTELALSISAACLGLLFAWSMYRRIIKKRNAKKPVKYFLVGLVKQVLSYSLEALPLHIALAQEVRCRHWKSHFAFVDANVTLNEGFSGETGTAKDSMLVLVAVMGEVKYLITNESLLAVCIAFFDLMAISIFILTVVRKTKHLLEDQGRRQRILRCRTALRTRSENLGSVLKEVRSWKTIRKRSNWTNRPIWKQYNSPSPSVTSTSEREGNTDEMNLSLSSIGSLCNSPTDTRTHVSLIGGVADCATPGDRELISSENADAEADTDSSSAGAGNNTSPDKFG